MKFKKLFWNTNERRIPALWRLLVQIVIAAAVMLPIGFFFENVVRMPLVNTLVVCTGLTISVWIAGRFLDRRRFADFGFTVDAHWWIDFFFGLALGLVLLTGIFLCEYVLGWITVSGTFATAQQNQSMVLALLVALITYICVGIYEELVFRGYQIRNVAEGLNLQRIGPRGALITAWILTSVLFGFAHLANQNASLVSTANIILAGVLLGMGYVFTGRLALPIGLHISWNFAEGVIFGFPVSGNTYMAARVFVIEQHGPDLWTGGAFGPEAGLLGIIAMVLGGLLTVIWIYIRYTKCELYTPLSKAPTSIRSRLVDDIEIKETA